MNQHKPQLRSSSFEMSIANTHDYALRKVKDHGEYAAVSGEFTRRAEGSTALPDVGTRRDLKFRSIGSAIQTSPGMKELHVSFTGEVSYLQTNEMRSIIDSDLLKWNTKPAAMTDADWVRLRRYTQPAILLDVELWLANEGAPAPVRALTRSEIDGDWTPNAPMSRVNVVQYAQEFSSARFIGEGDGGTAIEAIRYALGMRKFTIASALVLPVVQLDSFSSFVVPVVTLHLGGRTMGAHGIEAEFDLRGKTYFTT